MGSLFRSEEMALCQLFLQREAAFTCVSELGELGIVQFRDLNPDVIAFQRKFVNEVRRCDEMERKLLYLEREMKKRGVPIINTGGNSQAPQPREMINLEATFDKLEEELLEDNRNAKTLKNNILELTELKHILLESQVFFDEQEQVDLNSIETITGAYINDDNIARQSTLGPIQLGFVAGVILRERMPAFERMLWRACLGNTFLRQVEIETPLEDPITENHVHKSVFVVFFQGDQLKTRVKKICQGFRATLYPCPGKAKDRQEMVKGVRTRIEDLKTVLGQTEDHRHRVLFSAAKNLKSWLTKVRKLKAIYHTLNLFNLDITQQCLIAELWVPVLDIGTIQEALRRGTERSGSSVPHILNRMGTVEEPPTYNRTNKFTCGFQGLIDAYGVASYREMNPTPYTIVTFPFLFAVMFGDAGHGFIIFLFASLMILKEKTFAARKLDEISDIFFNGRYMILMMGIFSIYTGLIYNDIFSKSISLFGSSWTVPYSFSEMKEFIQPVQLNPNLTDYAYPFGMDPVWQLAKNKISFLNSYKMKISIIFGTVHMLFGIFIGLWNKFYFKKKLEILCEFIPQVLFLVSLFAYLVTLMFLKWVKYGAHGEDKISPFCAPSILLAFINMLLFKESIPPGPQCETANMYSGQEMIQKILVFLALLCIPWMMFAKPLLRSKENKKRHSQIHNHTTGNGNEEYAMKNQKTNGQTQSGHEEEEEGMGGMLIIQGIHTIEYVLGCVSHTASYLRLWALSLAHAQLSEVIWSKVLNTGFIIPGTIGAVFLMFVFAFWSILTISILVLMEGLSAFLHTLRLHWVEFQSKFYDGTGHGFQPFSFEIILNSAESD